MPVLPAACGEGLAVRRVGVGAIETAALAVARRAVALQIADVGIGRPAADLQSHDPRLDYDPTHPLPRPTFRGHPFEPIGCRLAAADPGAPSLPGLLPRLPTPSLAAHLSELQRAAIGFGRG